MAILTTELEIKQWLHPKIEIIVEEILAGIKEWNTKEIDRKVYDKGIPSVYERSDPSENFASAWDGKIKTSTIDAVEGEFYYQPDNMVLGDSVDGKHASMFSSEKYGTEPGFDIRPYLAEIIYEGLSSHVFGTGFWTEKRNAWEALLKIAKVDGAKMKTWINRGAKKAGLKIVW